MAQLYGYARVSTREQNEERQLAGLRGYGVPAVNIWVDKQSGKDFNRPAYRRLLAALKPGDTLVIKSVDRLGRDYGEILEEWRVITRERQSYIVVLDMPLLDTTRTERGLLASFISGLALQILSYVAQQEREFIRQRQSEGIAAAKTRGVRLGRPRKEKPARFDAVRTAWERKEISAREAARRLEVDRMTFMAWVRGK